jgi:excisionase family DNA binding protein
MSEILRDGVLTIEQAAKELGVSKRLSSRQINAGRLPAVRVGKQVRIPRSRFDLYISRHVSGVASLFV